MKKKGRELTEPTFTLNLGEGKQNYAVYILDERDTLRLPYNRRDGDWFSGPGIVTVQFTSAGSVEVHERYVDDAQFWGWIAQLAQFGVDAIGRGQADLDQEKIADAVAVEHARLYPPKKGGR